MSDADDEKKQGPLVGGESADLSSSPSPDQALAPGSEAQGAGEGAGGDDGVPALLVHSPSPLHPDVEESQSSAAAVAASSAGSTGRESGSANVYEGRELDMGGGGKREKEGGEGWTTASVGEEEAAEEVVEEEEEDDGKEKPASVFKAFAFASVLDYVLLFFGTVSAILHGATFPAAMFLFGDITTAFTNHAASRTLAGSAGLFPLTNGTVDCDQVYFPVPGNANINTTLQQSLNDLVSSTVQCLTDGAFITEIDELVIYFTIIAFGAFVLAALQTIFYQLASEGQLHRMRQKVYQAILRQDIAWFDTRANGELSTTLIESTETVGGGIGSNTAALVQYVSTFLSAFVLGFIRRWELALVLLAVTPFLILSAAIFTKVSSSLSNLEQKAYAAAGAVAEEVLSSIRTVVAFGGEDKEVARYSRDLEQARQLGAKKGVSLGFSLGLVYFLIFFVYALSFWFGGYLVSEGRAEPGDVLTVFFAILVGAFYLGQGGTNYQLLVDASQVVAAFLRILNREPEIDVYSEEGERLEEEADLEVELRNVHFSYPSRKRVQVLCGVSLKVGVGQTVAVVGPSGSGKSTVMALLLRMYDVTQGQVLLGGMDVRYLNLKWLRANIGVVSQEPVLFDTTIAENIGYGKEGATMEEIETAAKNANAHDFISQLPDGYNTHVGERGAQLSGGQKQRIAIARALVRNPKILLLDEATSALDTESEKIVQDALDKAREGRTTIVIAHRLSTIQTADVIVSLQGGEVAEIGTHTDLMQRQGLYYELVSTQMHHIPSKARLPTRLNFSWGSRSRSRTVYAGSGHRRSHYTSSRSSPRAITRSATVSEFHITGGGGFRSTPGRKLNTFIPSRKLLRSGTVNTRQRSSSSFRYANDSRSRYSRSRYTNDSRSRYTHDRSDASLATCDASPNLPRRYQKMSPSPSPARSSLPTEFQVGSSQRDEVTEMADVVGVAYKENQPEKHEAAELAPPSDPAGDKSIEFTIQQEESEFVEFAEPEEEEEEEEEIPISLLKILRLNSKDWWLLGLGFVGAFIVGCVFPTFAIVFGEVLRVFSLPASQVLSEIHPWGATFLGLGVAAAVGLFMQNACFSVSGENLTARVRVMAFQAMLRQEIGWFDDERNSTGALTAKLASDGGKVQGVAGVRVGTLVQTATALLLSVAISLYYTWLLTLIVLGVMPFVIASAVLHFQIVSRTNHSNSGSISEARKLVYVSVDNIQNVTVFGLQETFFQQLRTLLHKHHRLQLALSSLYGFTYGFSQATIMFAYIIAFRFGAFQVTSDSGSVLFVDFEDVYRVFAAIIFGSISIGAAAAFAPDYNQAKEAAGRVYAVIERQSHINSSLNEGTIISKGDLVGGVSVKNVVYEYPTRPGVPVLQDLSVSVKPGQTLALVGPSGSGKSTVVSLIERFYDPLSGSLTLDGTDLKDLNIRWLRSQIGIVSQEPVLFDTSIADNIRYGANFREVSDEEVVEAAKAANIHIFIDSLPQGYSTNVGSKGTQLSGGQKQRIAIARALVRNPKILLLDEATSALDTESEKIVQAALDKAREGRTTIVIAHRLSTIQTADHIVVLAGGSVLEAGTHRRLLRAKGMYYRLTEYQRLVK